jgi:hypothetical protein
LGLGRSPSGPGDYSMISFGVMLVNEGLDQTFYGRLKPISEKWIPEALAVSGRSRKETMAFDDPKQVTLGFRRVGERAKQATSALHQRQQRVRLAVHQLVVLALHGLQSVRHTSTNLGSLYKGLVQDTFQNFKHLRKTTHTHHHPVDDAKGNAEALLEMKRMGLKISI